MKNVYKRFTAWMAYNPPGALSSKGWRLFEREFKRVAPIRYWWTHDFRHKVTNPIFRIRRDILEWFRFRIKIRNHVIKTGLKPGYLDVSTRMLHSNFQLLKDFVEIDSPRRSELRVLKWYEKMPFYFYFKEYRDPMGGCEALRWATTLDDPNLPQHQQCVSQAVSARETLALYLWWVNLRPARKSIELPAMYSDQGLGILGSLDDDFDHDSEDYKKFTSAMEQERELESAWTDEDDAMLLRLVKIRHQLWT